MPQVEMNCALYSIAKRREMGDQRRQRQRRRRRQRRAEAHHYKNHPSCVSVVVIRIARRARDRAGGSHSVSTLKQTHNFRVCALRYTCNAKQTSHGGDDVGSSRSRSRSRLWPASELVVLLVAFDLCVECVCVCVLVSDRCVRRCGPRGCSRAHCTDRRRRRRVKEEPHARTCGFGFASKLQKPPAGRLLLLLLRS